MQDPGLTPYAWSLDIKSLWGRQWKALDKSVSNDP